MKTRILSLLTIATAFGFVACNNSSETAATTTDSSSTANTTTTTSTTNYEALADTFQTNSKAGNYLDPRTGKPLRISVNTQTGAKMNAETNEPVRYYVDRRTWWVYDANSGNTLGEAKMEGSNLRYKDQSGNWISAEDYWKTIDANNGSMNSSGTMNGDSSGNGIKKVSDGGNKVKTDDGTKVKVADHGDKVKVTDENGNKTKIKEKH
ncbi:MAG: hypothetical protein C4329_10330 [Chitinophagaceae bacterium]